MPEAPTQSEINSKTDPSVAKQVSRHFTLNQPEQHLFGASFLPSPTLTPVLTITPNSQWDNDTPKSEQISDLYAIIDKEKICMLNTYRSGTGPVGRAMAVASRRGPDLLFLANIDSDKFSDISSNPEVQVTFSDSTSVGWVSITGEAVTARNDDPRIKELWSRPTAAWFGDLGDGKHDGSADDPRMALIEVKAKYVSYWKKTTGTLGFFKEVGLAAVTGQVAQTGLNRRVEAGELEREREG